MWWAVLLLPPAGSVAAFPWPSFPVAYLMGWLAVGSSPSLHHSAFSLSLFFQIDFPSCLHVFKAIVKFILCPKFRNVLEMPPQKCLFRFTLFSVHYSYYIFNTRKNIGLILAAGGRVLQYLSHFKKFP